MSDVGSVVGVLSLSLQLLQGLQKYYTEFRSFHSDIDALINRAERLESILHVLEKPVQNLCKDDDELSEEVKKCMEVCEKVVARLRAFQQRCGEIDHRPETLRKKTLLVKRRALWPFKKDTLRDLHMELGWMVEGLQVVLQALGLETSIRKTQEVISQTATIRSSVSLVQHRQVYQTELLETINQNFENQINISSNHFSVTEAQAEKQSMQLSRVEEKIDNLVSAVGQVFHKSHSSLPSPEELRNSCDQYLDTVKAAQEAKIVADITQKTQVTKRTLNCTCTKASRRSGGTRQTNWLYVYFTEQRTHQPPCPLLIPSQRTRIAGIQLRLCRGALGYLIEANLAWSNFSINPSLTARNIVSPESPAFALIFLSKTACHDLSSRWNGNTIATVNNIIRVLEKTYRSLLQLLQMRKVRVHDVKNGTTWAHEYLLNLAQILNEAPFHARLLAHILSIISFIRELGFGMNEIDSHNKTPMDYFLRGIIESPNSMRSRFQSIPWKTAFKDMEFSTQYLDDITDHGWRFLIESGTGIYPLLFHIGDSELEFDCTDDPLNQAMTRRSKQALQTALDSGQITRATRRVAWQVLQWPDALELFLRHESVQDFLPDILDLAVYCERIDVVIKLLRSGIAPRLRTYHRAAKTENRESMKIIASALYESRLTWPNSAHETSYEAQLYATIADSPNLQEAATTLFEAGFSNFHADLFWETVACMRSGWVYADEYAMFWNWMVRHGVDISAIHPVSRLIPAHLLAEILVVSVSHPQKPWSRPSNDNTSALYEMTHEVLRSDTIDECVCLCADNGCTIVSSSLKGACVCANNGCKIVSSSLKGVSLCVDDCFPIYISSLTGVCRIRSLDDPSSYLNCLIGGLCVVSENNSDSLQSSDSFFQSAIRVLTFNSLGLTHTCHKYNYTILDLGTGPGIDIVPNFPDDPVSEDDIKDIRYAEQQDIGVFEDLLEKFDLMWVDYEGSVMDFVVKEWYPHMKEVLDEKGEIGVEDGTKALEQIGVVMQGCDTQPVREKFIRPKYGSMDWFDQTVQKILDGTYTESDLQYYWG